MADAIEPVYACDVFGAREVHVHVGGNGAVAVPDAGVEQLRADVDELHHQVAALLRDREEGAATLLGLQERQDRIYRLLIREGLLPRGRECPRVSAA